MEKKEQLACDLSDPTPLPANPVPAMAYVPYQQYNSTYAPEKGFDEGTIFPELNKPFFGRRGMPK